jgi:glycosyltransferase involved in cell wall biosynthesis/CelD/BcsL family acetyltransferase involved in cellulose biosynthesis
MNVYNGEPYVGDAVASILNQSYHDLELLVVDDGSTDSTPRVLARMDDPRMRVIRQENRGRATARNAALCRAQGQYVTFMDADDLCDQERIRKQVDYLTAHPELHGVGTWETVVDAQGNVLERPQLPCDPDQIRREYAAGRMGLNGASVMVRAEVLRAVGGFRAAFRVALDFDLWLRVTERYRIACLPEYLYIYRLHPAMCSHARKREQEFFKNLALQLRDERLATGTDRLDRGETIEIPRFEEERGKDSYRRALSWYDRQRSRELAAGGHWGSAWRLAVRSWRRQPLSLVAAKHIAKTSLAAVLPGTRPRLFPSTLPTAPTADGMEASGDGNGHVGGAAAQTRTAPRAVLVREIGALSDVWPEWDALLAASETPQAFFLTSSCVIPFWRWHGSGRKLTVVLVRDASGALIGVAPFYIETVGRRLSRHRRLTLLGSPESGADYLDVIARPGLRAAVLGAAFRCLKREQVRWDALNLDYILDDSPTLDLLTGPNLGPRFWLHRRPSSVCPFARLKPTWDEFVAGLGASTRRGMKYQLNLIRRRFSEVRFETVSDERRVPELIETLVRYKQAKYGHMFDYEYASWTDQALAALRAGRLRLSVLWLDGEPGCIWFAFLNARRVFFQACSYKPEFADLRLGKVMMAYAVESAIADGALEYDMKRGDADYKYHWANGERRTVQVNAVRRTLRGAWVSFWEYGDFTAAVRGRTDHAYRALRRTVRAALAAIARRWPNVVPRRLRQRLARPHLAPCESHAAQREGEAPAEPLAGPVAAHES